MTQVVHVNATKAASSEVQILARRLGSEIAKFGTVGAAAFVIDAGLFNVLRATVLSDSPLTAKTLSVLVATAFAFLANRHWTYRDRARTGYGRETILFFATNAAALLISWACLATSHYLLGLDSQLADNISGNVVAVGLGTLFRFWVYRTWVFPEHAPVGTPDATAPAAERLGQPGARLGRPGQPARPRAPSRRHAAAARSRPGAHGRHRGAHAQPQSATPAPDSPGSARLGPPWAPCTSPTLRLHSGADPGRPSRRVTVVDRIMPSPRSGRGRWWRRT